jgi:hypothetical protein
MNDQLPEARSDAPAAEPLALRPNDLLGLLPEPDLLADCAQSMVRGWTATALDDVLRMAAFGAWCAREFRRHLSDIDGGEAQDEMARLGVLELHQAQALCGEGCVCVEYGEFPHDCYRFTPGARQMVNRPNARLSGDQQP